MEMHFRSREEHLKLKPRVDKYKTVIDSDGRRAQAIDRDEDPGECLRKINLRLQNKKRSLTLLPWF
jgi:hypothetical protein